CVSEGGTGTAGLARSSRSGHGTAAPSAGTGASKRATRSSHAASSPSPPDPSRALLPSGTSPLATVVRSLCQFSRLPLLPLLVPPGGRGMLGNPFGCLAEDRRRVVIERRHVVAVRQRAHLDGGHRATHFPHAIRPL